MSISPTCSVSPNITLGCGKASKKDAWPPSEGQKCPWESRQRVTMVEEEEQDGRRGSAARGEWKLWCHDSTIHIFTMMDPSIQHEVRRSSFEVVNTWTNERYCPGLHYAAYAHNTLYLTSLYRKFAIYYCMFNHNMFINSVGYLNLDIHDFISYDDNFWVFVSLLSIGRALGNSHSTHSPNRTGSPASPIQQKLRRWRTPRDQFKMWNPNLPGGIHRT